MEPADVREIDRDQWVPFLAEFSKAHFGEPVHVRVIGRQPEPTAADGLEPVAPLMSIADQIGPSGDRIDVVTGAGRPVSYVVSHPVHVRVSGISPDRSATVQIDDADGSSTLLRFLSDHPGTA